MAIPHDLVIIGLLVFFVGAPGAGIIVVALHLMRRFTESVESRNARDAARRESYPLPPWTGGPDYVAPDAAETARQIAGFRLLVGRQHRGRSAYAIAATTVDEMERRSPAPPVDLVVATWLAAVQRARPVHESVYRQLGFSEHSLKIVTALVPDRWKPRIVVEGADVETVDPPRGFDQAQLHVWHAMYIETVGEPIRRIEASRMSALGRDGELAFESYD
jgi:hypothetical protein